MNALELKGGIYDVISPVNDIELLEQLYEIVNDFIALNINQTDFWDELSAEQQAELDIAVEESYDEANHIPHEEVVKEFQKWLHK